MKPTKQQLALSYYKEHVEGVPLTQDEVIGAFLVGFNSAEKRIKDKINAYKSQLKDLQSAKLSKRIDEEKIKELEIRIETLKRVL
jgi:hypothetical protein